MGSHLDGCRKSCKRGRFGVVDKADPLMAGHQLHAMRQWLEAAQAGLNLLRGQAAGVERRADGGGSRPEDGVVEPGVGAIVNELVAGGGVADVSWSVVPVAADTTEGGDGDGGGDIPAGLRQRGRQQGQITRLLLCKESVFGGGIGHHRPVTVEVVGLDIEQHRDFGMESRSLLQLEGAGFHHRPGAGGVVEDGRRERQAVVAGGNRRLAGQRQGVGCQTHGRRLALAAADSEDAPRPEIEAEIELGHEGDGARPAGLQPGMVNGKGGADDRQRIGRGGECRSRSVEFDAECIELRPQWRQALFRSRIEQGHAVAAQA